MKRKIILGFVATCIMAISLASCGGVSSAKTTEDGKIILKALMPNSNGSNYNDTSIQPAQAFITETTGYLVEYDELPAEGSEAKDKLNAIMAAGADYDFIVVGKDSYVDFAKNGALMDLKPLIEEFGTNIKAGMPAEVFDAVTIGDTYYSLPTMEVGEVSKGITPIVYGMYIRTDILEKMGMEKPETLDEFTALLQAYKDMDPMGNGNANVPFTCSIGDLMNLKNNVIGGAFGVELNWIEKDGAVVPYQTEQGFFEYLTYLHELYASGLMDAEMPTNDGASVKEKFTTDKALFKVDGYWAAPSLYATFAETNPEAEIEYIRPLENNGMIGSRSTSIYDMGRHAVIPANSKNAEDTIKFFDAKLEPTVFKEMVLGQEGVEYTVEEDGYYPILPTFFDNRGNANIYLTGVISDYKELWLCRNRKDANQYRAYGQTNIEYADVINLDVVSGAPMEVTSQIVAENTNSSNLTEEFMVNSIVNGVTQADFDTFVARWKSECGDKITEVYNEWYKNR